MVDSKRYDPTITRFQKHTKSFVSGKTKKGHLNSKDKEEGDVSKEEGILVRVDKNNLYGKGWEVKIDEKKIMCNYGDNIIYLPPYTVNGSYYVPKKECKVEVSIDKNSKINTITKIKDPNKQPISLSNKGVTLQGSGKASVIIEQDTTTISGDVILDTKDQEDLPDEISLIDVYKKLQSIESKLSDNNDI